MYKPFLILLLPISLLLSSWHDAGIATGGEVMTGWCEASSEKCQHLSISDPWSAMHNERKYIRPWMNSEHCRLTTLLLWLLIAIIQLNYFWGKKLTISLFNNSEYARCAHIYTYHRSRSWFWQDLVESVINRHALQVEWCQLGHGGDGLSTEPGCLRVQSKPVQSKFMDLWKNAHCEIKRRVNNVKQDTSIITLSH